MTKIKRVTAIVPIYNEEKTVVRVIKSLLKSKLIDEILAVNDGSTDKSLRLLKKFGKKIRLIDLKRNKGKGFALAKGVEEATGKIVCFIDADVVNLNDRYLKQLLEPVINDQWRGVIGIRKKNRIIPAPFAKLSGERSFYKEDLIPYLKQMKRSRFGIEVFFNRTFRNKPIKKVNLLKLRGLYKYEKWSLSTAINEYVDEGIEIAREIGRSEKLIPADMKIIIRLKKIGKAGEFEQLAKKINNKQVREFFLNYVVKNLKQARDWLK